MRGEFGSGGTVAGVAVAVAVGMLPGNVGEGATFKGVRWRGAAVTVTGA